MIRTTSSVQHFIFFFYFEELFSFRIGRRRKNDCVTLQCSMSNIIVYHLTSRSMIHSSTKIHTESKKRSEKRKRIYLLYVLCFVSEFYRNVSDVLGETYKVYIDQFEAKMKAGGKSYFRVAPNDKEATMSFVSLSA